MKKFSKLTKESQIFAQHIEANRHELGKGLDEMAEYKASEVMGHDAADMAKLHRS